MREALSGRITLKDVNNDKKIFTIIRSIGTEGGTSLSYVARDVNDNEGVLKEFYPISDSLQRGQDGQILITDENFREEFMDDLEKYIKKYTEINKMKHDENHKRLGEFVPPFYIYNGAETSYIWTPYRELYTFDKFCGEVHRNPTIGAKYRLIQIINAVKSLAECVGDLHDAQLLHMDIKPENFGFIERRNEPVTQALLMFDVNTIETLELAQQQENTPGTIGYKEPEAGNMPPDKQRDIYSIGAVLFEAVIIDNDNGYVYQLRENFEELVNSSPLIISAEINKDAKDKIAEILRKSLSMRSNRYKKCADIVSDLNDVLKMLGTIEEAHELYQKDERNIMMTMLFHLYSHTLFERMQPDDNVMRVLIIGFNSYGQNFLDACLQAGQIPGKNLRVSVVYSGDEKAEYLRARPELKNFFRIADEESYGRINFENSKPAPAPAPTRTDEKSYGRINFENSNNTKIKDLIKNRTPQYIFISSENYNVEEIRSLAGNCSVNLVQKGSNKIVCVNPVYVGRDCYDREIERMALNVHLIWNKNWNKEHGDILREFKDPYNYSSCVANVLSLKYKLFSVGIQPITDTQEAARLFEEGLAASRNELICCEHKRWVTDMLCKGWIRKPIDECNSFADRKDNKAHRHVCIVSSRPEQVISDEGKWADSTDKWDNAGKLELRELDQLDNMSVKFHRRLRKIAQSVNNDKIISFASSMRHALREYPNVAVLFEKWYSCISYIQNGASVLKAQAVRDKVNIYATLKAKFEEGVETINDSKVRNEIFTIIDDFVKIFAYVLDGMRYNDFKKEDVALIDNIPFILTYTSEINLVVPYFRNVNDRTKFFGNVASALVIHPKRIIYVCQYTPALKNSLSTLEQLVELIKTKREANEDSLSADIELVVIGTDTFEYPGINTKSVQNVDEAKEYIGTLNDGITVIESNSSEISAQLGGTFTFNSAKMKFENTQGFSSTFNYIKRTPFITAHDVFLLSAAGKDNPPEFFEDYAELWELYKQYRPAWKIMCNALDQHFKDDNGIYTTVFGTNYNKPLPKKTYRYILPSDCRKASEKIIDALRSKNIIEEGSHVESYNTTSCRVVIEDRHDNETQITKVFSKNEWLKDVDAFYFRPDRDHCKFKVKYNGMIVENCDIERNIRRKDNNNNFVLNNSVVQSIRRIMSKLVSMGYVFNQEISDDGYIELTFATPQIKDLLTAAGRMLEVFVYHKAREFSGFSDVVSSFETNRDGQAIHEYDLIITKGFQTLIVECKAKDITNDIYTKFIDRTNNLGINVKRVLVTDGEVSDDCIEYGHLQGVETIYSLEEIENIGEVLLNYIEGRFADSGETTREPA